MEMECNKDEAIRAREIPQHKMQNNDFEGAERIALKPHKLFPDLENITQLLTVYKNKFAGAEAVFKLIGEANAILTDQTKRSRYDTKTAPKPTAQPSNTASTASVDWQYKSTNNC
ncbi:hypothetical protein V6N11_071898 [Hibiscus sabdariffa]|uniref:J domain-containing protein n=1 Tax=Hibiscus sabdariffa TaxID=183260 RepID=A0ABR2U1Q2_9ROSI